MRRAALIAIVAAVVIAVAGCSTSKNSTPRSTSSPTTSSATDKQTGRAVLENAVRVALNMNNELSGYVLWNNTIPSWARESTAGPALATLTASAAARRKQGIRVKPLSAHLKVLSIQLAPSYASATATIASDERVAVYRHGRLEHADAGSEQDRLVLRRVGQAVRFVVWEVHQQK